MDFFTEAIKTLKTLVRAVNRQNRKGWERRKHWPPVKTLPQQNGISQNSVQRLSNRRKIQPCNKLIKPSAV